MVADFVAVVANMWPWLLTWCLWYEVERSNLFLRVLIRTWNYSEFCLL